MNNPLMIKNGLFLDSSAKTAHGLVSGSPRFAIKGIIDGEKHSGKDAGIILDNHHRSIPIYKSLHEAIEKNSGGHGYGLYAKEHTRYINLDGSFDLVSDFVNGGIRVEEGKMFIADGDGFGYQKLEQ